LYTADEIALQLNDCQAKYLVTIPQFVEKAQVAQGKSSIEEIFVFGEAEGITPFASLLQSDGQIPSVEINPKEDLIVLPYSSGTTCLSKYVMLIHHNRTSNALQTLINADFQEDEVMMVILTFFHIYGVIAVMNNFLHLMGTVV